MTSLVFNDPEGVSRSITDVPPTHYTVKVLHVSFRALRKLVIYPNGNKSRNVKEHLSLYLAMAGTNSLQTGWEVYAVFRLFVLDQNNDHYMVLQDAVGKERRFHGMKLEWGIDQFVSLKALNDASNGFLVDDTCVFGAEVFVCKERASGKGECVQMIKDPIMYKHTFKVDNYSKLVVECSESKEFNAGDQKWYPHNIHTFKVDNYSKLVVECSESKEFNAGDQKWKIRLYPNGKGAGSSTHLSLYLVLADSTSLPQGCKIYVEFTLRILNQINNNHYYGKTSHWFSTLNEEYGWSRFITTAYFRNPNSGFLVKDTSIIEAEVTIHGVVDAL